MVAAKMKLVAQAPGFLCLGLLVLYAGLALISSPPALAAGHAAVAALPGSEPQAAPGSAASLYGGGASVPLLINYQAYLRVEPAIRPPSGLSRIDLESPAEAIVVDNAADIAANDGWCTLREAIDNANDDAATAIDCVAGHGSDTIVFAEALGAATVTLSSSLPAIRDTDGLIIDGGGDIDINGADVYRIFYVNSGVQLSLSDLTLRNGRVTGAIGATGASSGGTGGTGQDAKGGCVYNNGGTITLTRATISHCSAFGGMGGPGGAGSPGYSYCVHWDWLGRCNGWAWSPGGPGGSGGQGGNGYGAAIFAGTGGVLNLFATTLTDNSAVGGLGGTAAYGESRMGYGGTGGMGLGGGLFSAGASATLINDTFSGNLAHGGQAGSGWAPAFGGSGYGGALYNAGATVIINNSTIADNQVLGGNGSNGVATAFGGGATQGTGSITLRNTIIANNTGGNCSGAFTSAGYNLESANTCGLTGVGDIINTEPLLGQLQDNGGPTLTRVLLAGSPAINTGNPSSPLWPSDPDRCATADQRGTIRPQVERCDVGAFESAPPMAVADLRAMRTDGGVQLAWSAVIADVAGNPLTGVTYTVYCGQDDPFFTPGVPCVSGLTANTTLIGSTAQSAFYVVQAIYGGLPSAISERVGMFAFPLVPGS